MREENDRERDRDREVEIYSQVDNHFTQILFPAPPSQNRLPSPKW